MNMPTVAGQLFLSSMPRGENSGVMLCPTAASMDLSREPFANEPSVPIEFRRFSASTIVTITFPASRMKNLYPDPRCAESHL